MQSILAIYYGFQPTSVKKLVGYDSSNFQVDVNNQSYILKGYQYDPKLVLQLRAENELLSFLSDRTSSKFPRLIRNQKGGGIVEITKGKDVGLYRLLTFLSGEFLAEVTHTPKLFASFGSFLGEMDKHLLDFYHPAIAARRTSWDLKHLAISQSWQDQIRDPSDRKIVKYFYQQYQQEVLPSLHLLRQSVIHNDANDWNVLVTDGTVSGMIDFGDIVYGPLIHELAIALTYSLMGKADPLTWALPLIKAYHKVLPLQTLEVDLLYYLVSARLCQSVCHSAKTRKEQPGNEYVSISEAPAWELLHWWLTINPTAAKEAFRSAISISNEKVKTVSQVIKARHKSTSEALSLSYKKPIYMERAAFQYMYDRYGNTYLDAYNNIPHVGHSHPKVIEAAQEQMSRLNTNTRYLYDQLNTYSENLLAKFPDSLTKVFLVNSGSAASDLALRLALNYTGKPGIMVVEHGYHGNTRLGIEVSHYKYQSKGGEGPTDRIIAAPLPDTYRGSFINNDGSAGKAYAQQALDLLQKETPPVAAFIAEPIVGCGGQVPLAKGYLKEIYPSIRKQGGVCISDEVQTGFGRLGSCFWGYEEQGVVPDIVILGKPMGNGHPIGAVVTTDAIAEAFDNGMEFFSSFGGNPVSCAIGQAVLDTLLEENLPAQARETGNYFISLLNQLKSQFPCIGDVRGKGLFLGVELIKEGPGKPDMALAQKLKNHLRDLHILVSTDGPDDNVIKMKPPLCFSQENALQVVEAMESILADSNR
ncbi:MAG: aminotransferase class III-fold pyridoxal phosphate-dependent enzyme [Cyclobacteriaceae bacterium]